MSHLPETKPAESEVPIKGPATAAISAAIPKPGREFEAFAHFCDGCNSSHKFSL